MYSFLKNGVEREKELGKLLSQTYDYSSVAKAISLIPLETFKSTIFQNQIAGHQFLTSASRSSHLGVIQQHNLAAHSLVSSIGLFSKGFMHEQLLANSRGVAEAIQTIYVRDAINIATKLNHQNRGLIGNINIDFDVTRFSRVAIEAEAARLRTHGHWLSMQAVLPNLGHIRYQSIPQFAAVGLLSRNELLTDRLLSPQHTFSAFVEHTSGLLRKAKNAQDIGILEHSLELADSQLAESTVSLMGLIDFPENTFEISEPRKLTLPFVQQEELLIGGQHSNGSNGSSELIYIAPSTIVTITVRKLLSLASQCNEAGKIISGEEIFKPTTRLLEVWGDLPWILPSDKRGFGEFIDCLYFLFYEGAGKDKLRFLSSHGGSIDDNDDICSLIWCIKHLRNKWIRHDADHGSDKDIRKSWSSLSDQLKWLGLNHLPTEERHFRHMHIQLLNRSVIFLETLLAKLTEARD